MSRGQFEETFLQGALYFGFPRALTAFQSLDSVWTNTDAAEKPSSLLAADDLRRAGEELFDRIYQGQSRTVREMLKALHPDLESFVIECAYGRILSRPGLSLLHREICATAVLATLAQEPQLIGHARAALALGLTADQLHEVLDLAVDDPELTASYRSRILPGS